MDAEQQSSHSALWMRNKDEACVMELLLRGSGGGTDAWGLLTLAVTSPHPDDACVETEAEQGRGSAGCLTAALAVSLLLWGGFLR